MDQHLLFSEYGAAGIWLYENVPSREYQAHIEILRGKAKKQREEANEAEREANKANNQAS